MEENNMLFHLVKTVTHEKKTKLLRELGYYTRNSGLENVNIDYVNLGAKAGQFPSILITRCYYDDLFFVPD